MVQNHLLLTGYRGCGKSGVGKLLAESLGRSFVDTDLEIESAAGQTIAEIFAQVGQEGFRDLESVEITRLASLSNSAIISLGGGAIVRRENRECIRSLGKTVWLQATPETIFARLSQDHTTPLRRPKLSNLGDMEEIASVLEMRMPWYNEVADLVVPTDGESMEQVAGTIVDWFCRILGAHRK